jgi:hypothetical protein
VKAEIAVDIGNQHDTLKMKRGTTKLFFGLSILGDPILMLVHGAEPAIVLT